MGEESSTFLDELIINELFVFDEDQMNGSLYVRFDHELTREIICKSIPPIQKNKLHNKVIEYLENIGEASSIFSFGQLAYHYENIQNYKRAAECANKEGHKLIGKSESSEAYKQFEKALLHIKSFSKVSNKDIFELEADSLNQLVRIGSDQIGYTETIYNQIRSLHVLTRLMKNDYYESIVYFYFAKYFFETSYDTNKSSEYIDKAIVCFKNKFPSEYAMSLNLKGVIEKNLGNYNNAIRLHNEAIKIFQEINSWVGLSESYIDLGAVFLESGNGHKTVDLWRKSIDSVKQTLNLTQISNRLVDYSYILALYNSISINVSDELENALFMAKRLRMEPNVCRALINYSNYLFFSESKDLVSIKKHIEEAMKISRENKYDYLLLLSQFSYLTFRNKHKNYFPKDYKKEIVEYLNNSPISEIKGDNRIINIIKFFILKKDKTIINWVRKTSNIKLKEFMKNLSSIPVIKIEKGNPYFHKDSYATYY